MSKNKKKSAKEAEFNENIITRLQFDWSKNNGKPFPLSIADLRQWQKEMSAQQHFWKLKDIFTKGKKASKPAKADKVTPKPWPFWTYDDVVRDKRLFTLMSEADMNKAVSDIEDNIRCPLAISFSGVTVLSLTHKQQCYEESGNEIQFGNAAFTISPRNNITYHLFTGANETVDAAFYTGYLHVQDKDDKDVWRAYPTPGFLVFKDKSTQDRAVELAEFGALVEIEEENGTEYLFTHYGKSGLFTKRLTSLENVDLFTDSNVRTQTA